MIATGIIRRIDDLGRVVIPKEIRYKMHIKEGDSMEFYEDENAIIIKKISTDNYTLKQTEDWIELLNSEGEILTCGHSLEPSEILTALGINFKIEEI